MKKIYKSVVLVAVAAASLVSCNKEVGPVENAEYSYKFTLSSDEGTKAILNENVVQWESSDKLGLYVVRGANTYVANNRYATVNLSDEPVTFDVTTTSALNSGDKVYAYYPYSSINYSSSVYPNAMVLSIPTSQRGTMSDMPMVSKECTLESAVSIGGDIPMGEIVMQNLCGVFQFNVYSLNSSYVGEVLKGVKFEASSPIAGVMTYNLVAGDLDISELGYAETTVMVENTVGAIAGSKTEPQSLTMIVAPGKYTGTVTVYTDKAEYNFNVSAEKTVERSHIKPLSVDLAKGDRTAKVFTDKCEIVFGEDTGNWTLNLAAWNANDYWPLATTSTYITSPVFEDLSQIKSIQVYARTYGNVYNNSNKLDIKVGNTTKTTHTLTGTYTEYEYIPTEGDLTGSGAISFVCPGGTNDSSSGKGIRIQRITIRYVDDSWAPKILDGEISQVPARSSNGRFTIQTKNIDSALEVLDYDGIDFVGIPAIENNNELVYTVSDNDSKDVKNGTITVALASDNSVTGTISISQAAARFSAARTSVDLKAAANSQTTVTITSDFDWTISGVDAGYTVSPSSFTYDSNASEPGKKTITIKATGANSGDGTVDLGSFSIVNAKSAFGSIEISVNQLSSKLPKPTITNVTGIAADKQAVIQWSKINNASTYTYYLINDNAEEVAGSRKTAENSDELSAIVDIPNYGENYYFCIFAVGSGDWTDSQEATSDAINLTEPSGSFTGTIASWTSTSTNTISSNAWASKGSSDMCGTGASITLKNSSATVQTISSQTVGSGANAWYLVYGNVAGNSYWDISMTTTQNLASGTKIKVVAYIAVNSKGITSWTAQFNAGGSSSDVKMGDDISGVVTNGSPSKLTDMTKVERVYTLTSDVASGTTIHVKLVAGTGTAKNGRLSDVTITAE